MTTQPESQAPGGDDNPPVASGGTGGPWPEPPLFGTDGVARDRAEQVSRTHGVHAGEVHAVSDGDRSSMGAREVNNIAWRLTTLARRHFSFHRAEDGEPFALPASVATQLPVNVRIPLRGREGLRTELAAMYFEEFGRPATNSALTDTLTALEGLCRRRPATPTALRVASVADRAGGDTHLVLDLGRHDGEVVEIRPGQGWRLAPQPLFTVFRRSSLTGEQQRPSPCGEVDEMRKLLRLSDTDWELLLGWLVSAYLPAQQTPIAFLTGEQGTGKTTVARMLVDLVDPSPAPVRTLPSEERDWVAQANASYVIALDNVSRIRPWLSDALCQAVTGSGWVSRALYTDSEPLVLFAQRSIILTSIDAGALRGDLAERLLPIELMKFNDTERASASRLDERWSRLRPCVLGGLLTLVSQVLAVLPTVELAGRPRMADFMEVLAAIDAVRGTRAAAAYLDRLTDVQAQVGESDPVIAAIHALLTSQAEGFWGGTASDLARALGEPPAHAVKLWPRSPQAMSAVLRRGAPALRALGVEYTPAERGSQGVRNLTLRRTDSRQGAPQPDAG